MWPGRVPSNDSEEEWTAADSEENGNMRETEVTWQSLPATP